MQTHAELLRFYHLVFNQIVVVAFFRQLSEKIVFVMMSLGGIDEDDVTLLENLVVCRVGC